MGKIDNIDRPTDALFLLFYYAREVRGITKVQKLLFLMEEESSFGEKYRPQITLNFKGYKMGPFSPDVYDEVEFLLNLGALEKEPFETRGMDAYEIEKFDWEEGSEGLSGKLFKITDKGDMIAEDLVATLDEDDAAQLREMIEHYNSMTLMELLEYVYKNYENMTTESEIKNQVLY